MRSSGRRIRRLYSNREMTTNIAGFLIRGVVFFSHTDHLECPQLEIRKNYIAQEKKHIRRHLQRRNGRTTTANAPVYIYTAWPRLPSPDASHNLRVVSGLEREVTGGRRRLIDGRVRTVGRQIYYRSI